MKKAIEIFLGIYFTISAIIQILFWIDISKSDPCPHGYRHWHSCPICYYGDE